MTDQTCEPVCATNYDTEGEADGFTLNCDVDTGAYGGSDTGDLQCFRTWGASLPLPPCPYPPPCSEMNETCTVVCQEGHAGSETFNTCSHVHGRAHSR